MANEKTMTSPIGTALWAKINNKIDVNPNSGKKTFQVHLILSNEEAAPIIKSIHAALEEYKALPENKGKKWTPAPSLGYEELDDGKTDFKIWTSTEFEDKKTGAVTPRKIPVFVVNQGFITNSDKNIGNGSSIQVLYSLRPFHSSATSSGVSLLMHKVLVHNLIEFGGNSEDMSEFGIDTSGYVEKAVTAENFLEKPEIAY